MPTTLLPVQYWIDNLKLVEHPGDEDGFFCEAFWDDSIKVDVNSPDGEKRCIASIAYFLQEQDEGVHEDTMFFQLQSSEMLFYHYGDPLLIYILEEKENEQKVLKKAAVLGTRVDIGECLSFVFPKGSWFTRLVEKSDTDGKDPSQPSYTVYSCSLVPGFDIRDFRSMKYKDLIK